MAKCSKRSLQYMKYSSKNKYELGDFLGEGSYGVTFACTNYKSKKNYACKMIPKFQLTTKERLEVLQREIDILHSIKSIKRHNLISIQEVFSDDNTVHIVMELCRGGTVSSRLKKCGKFEEVEAANIIKEVMVAISACHKHGIVHRDLKLNNVMYETNKKDSKVKLIDFGLSSFYKENEPLEAECGNVKFMAPEMFRHHYGPKVDIWSAGVMLYVLLFGRYPFRPDGCTKENFIRQIYLQNLKWGNISMGAKDLIQKMLEVDVNKRLSASQVLEHPWIKQMTPTNSLFSRIRTLLDKHLFSACS